MTTPDCKFEPGLLQPLIDRNRCEAKGPCVEVCPFDVFVLRLITPDERLGLSLKGRIKALVHGGMQADAQHAERCRGCGLCVAACPERAITLQRRAATPAVAAPVSSA
jgi:4Fe-4S ferredoxin